MEHIDGAPISRTAAAVWAKTGDVEGQWMPLYQHMRDTAAVGGWLWDNWLPRSTRALLTGAVDAGMARKRFVWMCAVHDIGKATPPFAGSVPALKQMMADEGLAFTSDYKKSDLWHSTASHALVYRWLTENHNWRHRPATSYAVVPGSHHGITPTSTELDKLAYRGQLMGGDRSWRSVQDELTQFSADVAGLDDSDLHGLSESPLNAQQQTVMTGLLTMADWLASDPDRFPLDGHCPERAAAGIRTLNLPAHWQPEVDADDVERFYAKRFAGRDGAPFSPRPSQRDGLALARSMTEPGLVIVEAPMGEGKTELAFAMAETLAAKFGFGGIFTALPTMATSNAMFTRFAAYLNVVTDGLQSLHLAHSKRELNEDFMNLDRVAKLAGIGDDTGDGLAAHDWLQGNGKLGVLSSFVVGTIDQVLYTALNKKYLMLRHLALVNKVVVIDEVHAADAYMGVYLDRTLAWLGSYGIPVILMSATLPATRRAEMLEAYRPGSTKGMVAGNSYPLITATGATGIISVAPERSSRSSQVVVRRIGAATDAIVAKLGDEIRSGGVAAVIRNTVGSAQETADMIRSRIPDCEVILSHSRFTALDRARIEAELLEKFGEGSTSRPFRAVVVGTQVLEQSLDVDFDLMVTDLAPVDLVLQRVGRLHRHRRPNRPAHLSEPVCYVAGLPEADLGAQINSSVSSKIYLTRPLLRAAIALNRVIGCGGRIELPADIPNLVAEAYSDATPDMGDEVAEYEQQWAQHLVEQQGKASTYRLGLPGLHAILDLTEAAARGGGDPDAGVRDIDSSLEVVVLYRDAQGILRTLPHHGAGNAGLRVVEAEAPDARVQRAVKQSSVRMPRNLSFESTREELVATLPEGWTTGRSAMRWLVPLILDEQLEATVGGTSVRYSAVNGLETPAGRSAGA